MKKFLLTTLLVLVTVVAAFAQNELTVKTNTNNRPPYTLKNGNDEIMTISTEKGTASNDIGYRSTTIMLMYNGNILNFAMNTGYELKKVQIKSSTSNYVVGTDSKWDVSGGDASVSDAVYTWNAPNGVTAASLTMAGTYRIQQITVTYSKAAVLVDANASFEVVETTYDPANPYLTLQYTPADLFDNGAKVSYNLDNADGALEVENGKLKIVKATSGATLNVSWTGSTKYKDSSVEDVMFAINKAQPGLAYSKKTAEVTMGDDVELPTLSNPYNLAVRYSSSSRAIADIDDTGAVTIVAAGKATIAAYFEGNSLIESDLVTYDLTVNPEGKPAKPEFSFDGTKINDNYTVDSKLIIETATNGAQVWYSLDGAAEQEYTAAIELKEAKTYNVTAYAKKGENKSDVATTSFTIVKKVHDYAFGAVAEQMVGRDRYFTMPTLTGAEGVDVKYELIADNGVLLAVPGEEGKYFITGAGDVMVTATVAGNANYDDFTTDKTVTIVPQTATTEVGKDVDFDFTKPEVFGLTKVSDGGTDAYVLNGTVTKDKVETKYDETLSLGGVTMSFNKNQATTNTRIVASGYLCIYKKSKSATDSQTGGSMTINANNIQKVELTIATKDSEYSVSSGTLSSLTDKVRTWIPNEGEVVNTLTIANVGKDNNPQITHVKVYYTETVASEPAKPFDLKFEKEEYALEVGEKLPKVVLPEGYNGPVYYVVDNVPVEDPANYVFTAVSDATVIEAYAFIDGKDAYLPDVAETLASVSADYELADALAMHFTGADGKMTEVVFANGVNDNGTMTYTFSEIDIVPVEETGKGKVFFSFYANPASEPAAAPRRAAAAADWAALTDNYDVYAAATDGLEAGENTPLVRYRKGSLTEAPAVFAVPFDGMKKNITVTLDKAGTSTVKAANGQTQTGVESVGVDAEGEEEYYTLQGIRVERPTTGIYLRRHAGKVSKVLVK